MKLLIGLSALILSSQSFEIKEGGSLRFEELKDAKDCVEKNCKTQLQACLDDSACKAILEACSKECSGKPDECWARCLLPKRNKKVNDIVKCAHDHQCIKPPHQAHPQYERIIPERAMMKGDPIQCMEKFCHDQVQDCKKDDGCGKAFRACMEKCRGKDRNCMTTCISASGQLNAMKVVKCGHDNNCFDEFNKKISNSEEAQQINKTPFEPPRDPNIPFNYAHPQMP